ncbi:hypothetical protein CEXT_480981 [Caerostris extrusa]|uniref:Uncharacterized protein n=1 Tax=Caerostris extrusa TaxID=172846 RepID=A0AAV4RCP5_CAEEX|nr:hypothetical protein CEXT_480981 [Caerostris extrusa]
MSSANIGKDGLVPDLRNHLGRVLEKGRGRHVALIDFCLNGTVSHGNVLFLQQMGLRWVFRSARDFLTPPPPQHPNTFRKCHFVRSSCICKSNRRGFIMSREKERKSVHCSTSNSLEAQTGKVAGAILAHAHPPSINCRMAHALNMGLIRRVCDMTQIVSYFCE